VGEMGLNFRENSIHFPANSVLPDMRKKSNDVQLAAASICFPKLSRSKPLYFLIFTSKRLYYLLDRILFLLGLRETIIK
jgi:hypothetical protein